MADAVLKALADYSPATCPYPLGNDLCMHSGVDIGFFCANILTYKGF